MPGEDATSSECESCNAYQAASLPCWKGQCLLSLIGEQALQSQLQSSVRLLDFLCVSWQDDLVTINRDRCNSYLHLTQQVHRPFSNPICKCLLIFSSTSREKLTAHKKYIIIGSSISSSTCFCIYSYETLMTISIF